MPIYEYEGQQYDIDTTDQDVARATILQHLGAKPAAPVGRTTRPGPSIGSPMGDNVSELFNAATNPEPTPSDFVSVLEGAQAPAPLKTEDTYVVNPQFVAAMQKRLDAMPEQARNAELAKLTKRPDVYGRAARAVAGRYGELDKITSPTLREQMDPRLEVQTQRYIKQGASAETAENIAKTRAATIGIGRDLQGIETTLAQQQAAAEAERVAKEMEGAGFAERVGAETASGLRKTALGIKRVYADVIGDEDLQKDLARYSEIEEARGKAVPKGDTLFERSAQQAMATLTQQAPMILISAATGTAMPVLAHAAITQFAQSYNESRGAGQNASDAAVRAGLMATAEVFFERFGLAEELKAIRSVAGSVPTNKLSGYLASAFLKEVPSEQATTLSQFLIDKLPQIGMNQGAGLADLFEQSAETLRQTVLQSGAQSAATYGAGATARKLQERALNRELQKGEFEQGAVDEYARRALSPQFYSPETIVPGVRADVGAPETRAPMPMPPEGFVPPAAPPAAPSAPPAPPTAETPAAPPAAPAPAAPAEPPLTPRQQASYDRYIELGYDPEDARDMVIKAAEAKAAAVAAGTAPKAAQSRVDELTEEYIDAGLPPAQAKDFAIKQAAKEAEADALAEATEEGATDVAGSVPSAGGEGVGVAGVPGAGAPAKRAKGAKRTGVVPPATDVGQPSVRKRTKPVAVKTASDAQPKVGEQFNLEGWEEQENKINKKTGQPSLEGGRVRYKRTDSRGFVQNVVVKDGKVTQSSAVSPLAELTNSYLEDGAPVKGRVMVSHSDVAGTSLLFVPEGTFGSNTVKMSPRAVQQYEAGVPLDKVLETEFSDAGGIRPDGSRTPHTTTVRVIGPEKTDKVAAGPQGKAGVQRSGPTEDALPAKPAAPKYKIQKAEVETADGKIKAAWNVVGEDGYVHDTFDRRKDASDWVQQAKAKAQAPVVEAPKAEAQPEEASRVEAIKAKIDAATSPQELLGFYTDISKGKFSNQATKLKLQKQWWRKNEALRTGTAPAVEAPKAEAPKAEPKKAKAEKRIPPAKVVEAAPGTITPESVTAPKKRGRPTAERTPEQAEKVAKQRREATLAANAAAREVAKAEKALKASAAPAKDVFAEDEKAAKRKEAINTLYALSRRNKNKPGQRAAELLKTVSKDELNAAKTEYEGAAGLMPAKEEIVQGKPGVNMGRMQKLLGPKLYGTSQRLTAVTIKEVFQNAFDAVKEAIEKGVVQRGRIKVKVDAKTRQVTIIDNGMGMPTSVMGNQFMQIAGTLKGSSRASGGLGIAKMLFLFENNGLEVVSLRDGVLSRMSTSGAELQAAMDDANPGPPPTIQVSRDASTIAQFEKTLFPDGHGTAIIVNIPETYVDPTDGETKEIEFDTYNLDDTGVLAYSPLFDPITVELETVSRYGTKSSKVLDMGDNFPLDKYTPFANVNFNWGTARILVSKDDPKKTSGDNVHILSNGLWQFSFALKDKPSWDGRLLPRTFYIDVSPQVRPEDQGYPFDLNRQRFSPTAKSDFEKIGNYLVALFRDADLAESAKDYGTVRYFGRSGKLSAPELIQPTVPASETPLTKIQPDDDVEVRDGVVYVNNRALPEITPEQLSKTSINLDELKVPQDSVNVDAPMLHDNSSVPSEGGKSVSELGQERFGDRFNKYVAEIASIFLELRNALADADDLNYSEIRSEAVGVTFGDNNDNSSLTFGVSIRVPFNGMFINPGITPMTDNPKEIASGMLLTMQHEMAHHKQRGHDARFVNELQRIITTLDTRSTVDMGAMKRRLAMHIKANEDIFNYLNGLYRNEPIATSGRAFKEPSYQSARNEEQPEDIASLGRAGQDERVRGGAEEGAGRTGAGQVAPSVSAPAEAGRTSPLDARSERQLSKEFDKALDNFERSADVTDIADNISVLSALRDPRKYIPYFKGIYDKVDSTRLGTVLGLVTNDTLSEWGSQYIPELTNTNKQLRLMRTMTRNLLVGAKKISDEVQRALKEDPSLRRKLERVTSVATDIRVDPAIDRREPKLNKLYADLGPRGQELYVKLRDYYADILEYYEKLLDDQIATSNLPPEARGVLMAEIRKMYETDKRIVPFFPFVRNRGQLWLSANKGKERQFYTFGNHVERQMAMDHLAKEQGKSVKELLADEYFRTGDSLESFRNAAMGDMPDAIKKIFQKIDDSVDPQEIAARVAILANTFKKEDPALSEQEARSKAYEQAKDEVTRGIKDTVYELALMSLPEQSFRRGFIARKDIPGYNTDLLRNFATHTIKVSSQLPRIKYGGILRRSLRVAEKTLDGNPEKAKLIKFVDEMTRRVDLELNPYPEPPAGISPSVLRRYTKAVDFATRMTFTYFLSAGASAVTQLTGILYGASTLGSRHGYARTLATMGKVMSVFNEFGVREPNADGTKSWHPPSIVYSKRVNTSPMEQRFIRDMLGAGIGERTMIGEMLNRGRVSTAEFEGVGSKFSRGLMMAIAGPFQTAERLVQETLAISSFRMSMEDGRKKGLKGEELYQYAADQAIVDVFDSVGNMAETNRPPFMRGATGRLLLQFMPYVMFITSRWMREGMRIVNAVGGAGMATFRGDLSKASAEVKAGFQALKEFAGIMGVTFMLAGIAGLPFVSTMIGFFGAFMDDEEDKRGYKLFKDLDYWTWWREKWLPEYLGKPGIFGKPLAEIVGMDQQKLATLITRGPVNAFLGIDLASRTSINPTDMLAGQDKETRTTKEGAIQFALSHLGPTASMLMAYMDAYDAFADGDIQRGMEKVLPAVLRNPVVANKVWNEGVKDYKGATLLKKDAVTTGQLLYQAIGFRMDELANQQKVLFAIAKQENKIRFERENILKNLRESRIVRRDDARFKEWMGKLDEFNKKYPSYAIEGDDVVRAVTSAAERAGTAVRGFTPTEQNVPVFGDVVLSRAEAMRKFEEEQRAKKQK